jgi:hypothetical protein
LAHVYPALSFDFCDIPFSEFCQQFPDEMNFLFSVFGQGVSQTFDDTFAFFRFFVDLR